MKKIIAMFLLFACVATGCKKEDTFQIRITLPAGDCDGFAYSQEEISSSSGKITLSAGEGLGDSEVVLEAVDVKKEKDNKPTYLTPGMPVEMDVEKGSWYKVGVSMRNERSVDLVVYVEVEGVGVRMR